MVSTDRSLRSVFVGNIPYDATEEKLKEIFCEVGPVQSFRLVYDRETGKPKGYGFCEYKDQETAHSAIRNLNNFELSGRTLRVDSAANERNREEMRNLPPQAAGMQPPPGPMAGMQQFQQQPEPSPYGSMDVEPERAPEAIGKAVASLPPEQMFELARQMKNCVQLNPQEARNMLMQNPQLTYALLQALVVMRVVKPEIAQSILFRPNPAAATPIMPLDPRQQQQQFPHQQMPPADFRGPVVGDPRSRPDPRLAAAADPRVRNQMQQQQQAVGAIAGAQQAEMAGGNQQMMLQQVMSLSEAQIAQLPPEDQETIRALKRELTNPRAMIR